MSSSRAAKGDIDLRLDWCSHRAAKWALGRWYYRPTMPIGKLLKIGVWEEGAFSGVVIFGMGSSDALGRRWGLGSFEVCELSRLALKANHRSQVSRVVKVALLMLRRQSPGIRAVVSFADPTIHYGGVYQAGGWVYTGTTAPDRQYRDANGKVWHSREAREKGWRKAIGGTIQRVARPSECTVEILPGKHRYVMALDVETARLIAPFAKQAPAATLPPSGLAQTA